MKMRITILALAMVALATSTASADLVLDVKSSTGGSTLAVSASLTQINNIQLFATVTGGTDPTLYAWNKFYYSIYSSDAGTNTTPAGLTRIDFASAAPAITTTAVWQTSPVNSIIGYNEDDSDPENPIFTPIVGAGSHYQDGGSDGHWKPRSLEGGP